MLSTETKKSLGPVFNVLNKARLHYLRVRYRGEGVECVCCGSHFAEFAPFGDGRRRNAWCPRCESLERHRLLWMFLERETGLYTKPTRLLHVAPETLFFRHFVQQANIDYHPVDKFPTLYPAGTAYMDILAIAMPGNHYDAIICNHVFQYIEEDAVAMQELCRVLKPGGWAVMQVPINKALAQTHEDPSITDPKEREKIFGLKEHVRFYAMDYSSRLRQAGFNVTVVHYTDRFSNEEHFRYGFWVGDPVFFCRKPA